jgi:PAS domain S-box-containing protein
MPGLKGTPSEPLDQLSTLVLEHLESPVVVLDGRGHPVLLNQAARRLLGVADGALPDQPFWACLNDPDVSIGRVQLQAVISTAQPTTVEHDHVDPDGSVRRMAWRWTPLPGANELEPRAVGIGTDVTTDFQQRKRNAEAISSSEERTRALLQVIPDLMFRLDADGKFLEFYAASEQMLYAPPHEILGHSLRELLPEPVASESLANLRLALETGTVQVHEYALPVAPGHQYFEARHIAIGRHDEVLTIVRDVTDRKLAEQSLRASEQQYRMLLDRASDAIIITDPTGQLVTVNQQACLLLGWDESELLTMQIADLVPEPSEHVDGYFRALREGEPIRIERKLRHRDGHWVDVEVGITVMPNGRVQGIVRDVTERKRAEAALRRSEESFRRLIERSPDLIVVHRGGRIVWVNEACARTFGVAAEEMRGRPVLEFVHPDDRELVVRRIRRQKESGEAAPPVEERFVRSDGSIWIGEVVAIPLDFHGEPSNIVVAHDITERKRAEVERLELEARIQHTQKLESLGVLAGGIAHDFNNLLMGVLGNASLALLDLPPESTVRGSVKRIETAAHRASDLTKQLLAYSGKGRFVVQYLDLSKVVEEMVHLLKTVISKKATLRFDFAPKLPSIEADATQMRQVVMNLITNASDALGEAAGIITIRTGVVDVDAGYLAGTYLDEDLDPGEYVYLEVADTGCGMDVEAIRKIFDPFYTTKFTGRGLGLAAVLGIVRGHHGAIDVDSEPGQGSCFKVLFPRAAPDHLPEARQRDEVETWRGSGAVLVVDDEETVRSVASLVLERYGFEVMTANDGEEAVEVYKEHRDRIRLVLLDMTMPRMGGEETFKALVELNPNVRILLSSGYNEQEAIGRFAGSGLAGFIQKPYTPTELVNVVRKISGDDR